MSDNGSDQEDLSQDNDNDFQPSAKRPRSSDSSRSSTTRYSPPSTPLTPASIPSSATPYSSQCSPALTTRQSPRQYRGNSHDVDGNGETKPTSRKFKLRSSEFRRSSGAENAEPRRSFGSESTVSDVKGCSGSKSPGMHQAASCYKNDSSDRRCTSMDSSEGEGDSESHDNSDSFVQKYTSNPAVWSSAAQHLTRDSAPKVEKLEREEGGSSNVASHSFHNSSPLTDAAPTLPKLEPLDLKNQILTRLKQEYGLGSNTSTASASTMAAAMDLVAAVSDQGLKGVDMKDGQLRDLLLLAGAKDLTEEAASKALLQLSAQRPDFKHLSSSAVPHLIQQFLQQQPTPPSGSHSYQQSSADLSPPGSATEPGHTLQLGQDGSLRPKKIRHKKRVNGQKICLVCGDRALAHNFDVITCESCKAFFRRNALKSQSLQRCMFQNSCAIDKNTRRFCPSCRLKKCFDIGMKPELMLDDEERRLRQEKKAQRIKRQAATSSSSSLMDDATEMGSSGSAPDLNPCSHSPDPSATPRHAPASPAGDSQSRDSSTQPSPLPSFHTLREPVTSSSSSNPGTPGHQSSAVPFGYGQQTPGSHFMSPATASGLMPPRFPAARTAPASSNSSSSIGLGLPSQDQSPFSSLLSQLSSPTSGQSPRPPPLTLAQQQLQMQQQQQQQQEQQLLQSALSMTSRSPFSTCITSPAQAYGLPQSHDPAHSAQLSQFPPSLPQQPHPHQQDDDTEGSHPSTSVPQSTSGEKMVFHVDNCPYPLPGPAARLFTHVPRDKLPSDPFMYWIVSGEERLMLANLTIAYQDVLLSLNERGLVRNVPINDNYFIHDFLNEIDDAMYKIVQFSKHIADFRLVRKEDQIAMLKSSAMQTLGIACCAVYVHERDCWLSLRGDLTLSHLRKLTHDDPYIQIGVEYCRSVKSLVKNDFTIYALVHCMILFDPRDAKIVDRQLINQTRDKFVIMLKHYLESQFSYSHADEYFVAIQDRVREMCHLAQSGNALFKRYSSAFQPLITEMLSST